MINLEETLNEINDLILNNDNSQNEFFQSTFGKIINFSLDTGIRALLPDFIENEVIDVKDTIINEGFSEGIKSAIDSVINIGKNALGIVTGEFENVSQVEKAIEKGGIIDNVSNVLDTVLDKISESSILPESITSIIKNGKDVILNNISSNIKNEFESQEENIENLSTYTSNWKESFKSQDIEGMENYMQKIKSTLDETMPIENLISEARTIENLHELIINNGNNFDLTEDELQLANLLT